jgi:hypothetical protein
MDSTLRKKILQDNGYLLDKRGRLIHRLICIEAHGQFPSNWIVHHIDENKLNNSPENLIALPRRLHAKIHSTEKREKVLFTRKNLENMVKSYTNLSKNKDLQVHIHVTVSYEQTVETEKQPIVAKVVAKSGSSLYR